VAQRIVHEVCHQALDQSWITFHAGRADAGVDMDASALGFSLAAKEHPLCDPAELD
jgi:hypothetical protein